MDRTRSPPPHLRPDPAPGHAEASRLRRNRVLRLPPLARLRPRPRLRERVPPLLRAEPEGPRRLPPHLSRDRETPRPAGASTSAPSARRCSGRPSTCWPTRDWSCCGRLGATGVAADGFSWPYVAAACYASALYGFLGLLLIHDALRRFLGYGRPPGDGRGPGPVARLAGPLLHDGGPGLLPRPWPVRGGAPPLADPARMGDAHGGLRALGGCWASWAASPPWCASRTGSSW